MSLFNIIHPLRCTRAFHSSAPRSVLYSNADLEVHNKALSDLTCIDKKTKTFSKVTAAKDRITLVDFYADWCGPCHQLAPIVEKLTNEPNKSGSNLPFDLVKINTDTEIGQALGGQYKVRALPTVIAFRNGTIISQFVGALSEPEVNKFLEKL